MAIVVKKTERYEIPHEAGQWVELRLPICAGDLAEMRADGKKIRASLDLMVSVVQAWSYDVPVTSEHVNSLDVKTFAWLDGLIQEHSGLRDDDEKKG